MVEITHVCVTVEDDHRAGFHEQPYPGCSLCEDTMDNDIAPYAIYVNAMRDYIRKSDPVSDSPQDNHVLGFWTVEAAETEMVRRGFVNETKVDVRNSAYVAHNPEATNG